MKTKHDLSVITNYDQHTMGMALEQYIAIKIHPLIDQFQGHRITVRGRFERTQSHISSREKTGKLFNWKRPTAELSADKQQLYLNCFPGADYVVHYASLVSSYLTLKRINGVQIGMELPTEEETLFTLRKTNLKHFPKVDIVILGAIERLKPLMPNQEWSGDGDFRWLIGTLNNQKVALLGCQFSYWGNIAGCLVQLLALKGVKTVIYTGKLGGLKTDMRPNSNLATGTKSILHNQEIQWPNVLCIPQNKMVIEGVHVTLPSVLSETKRWFAGLPYGCSFVDPEIGHMANKAKLNRIDFSYIHLVSDNVAHVQHEHLGNERDKAVIKKRQISNFFVLEILYYTLIKLCNQSHVNFRFFKNVIQQLKEEAALEYQVGS